VNQQLVTAIAVEDRDRFHT